MERLSDRESVSGSRKLVFVEGHAKSEAEWIHAFVRIIKKTSSGPPI